MEGTQSQRRAREKAVYLGLFFRDPMLCEQPGFAGPSDVLSVVTDPREGLHWGAGRPIALIKGVATAAEGVAHGQERSETRGCLEVNRSHAGHGACGGHAHPLYDWNGVGGGG